MELPKLRPWYSLRRNDQSNCVNESCRAFKSGPLALAICCLLIALVSVHDAALVVTNHEVINEHNINWSDTGAVEKDRLVTSDRQEGDYNGTKNAPTAEK